VTGTAPPDLDNVLLTDWTGPFGGVPAFDRMELDALKPALESGMASQLAEIDAIASNPEPRPSKTPSSRWNGQAVR